MVILDPAAERDTEMDQLGFSKIVRILRVVTLHSLVPGHLCRTWAEYRMSCLQSLNVAKVRLFKASPSRDIHRENDTRRQYLGILILKTGFSAALPEPKTSVVQIYG